MIVWVELQAGAKEPIVLDHYLEYYEREAGFVGDKDSVQDFTPHSICVHG